MVNLTKAKFHGEWNYSIAATASPKRNQITVYERLKLGVKRTFMLSELADISANLRCLLWPSKRQTVIRP